MSVTVNGVSNVIGNLKSYAQRLTGNANVAAEEIALLLTAYAKNNHPWQNQTGDTEATTEAKVTQATRELIEVTLSAGTSYAQFLEMAHSGKYSWLWPAMVANEDAIKRILIGRLKGTNVAGSVDL